MQTEWFQRTCELRTQKRLKRSRFSKSYWSNTEIICIRDYYLTCLLALTTSPHLHPRLFGHMNIMNKVLNCASLDLCCNWPLREYATVSPNPRHPPWKQIATEGSERTRTGTDVKGPFRVMHAQLVVTRTVPGPGVGASEGAATALTFLRNLQSATACTFLLTVKHCEEA